MAAKKKTKMEKSVLTTVLNLEISKGHLKWKVTDLARLSKVSRPLIYYHFGKTKSDILDSCLDLVAFNYYGLDEERIQSLSSGHLLESLRHTRELFLKTPSLILFYQKWRALSSPLQKRLIAIEKRYQKKLSEAYSFLNPREIIVLHALMHGAITAPFLDPASFDGTCVVISSWIESRRF